MGEPRWIGGLRQVLGDARVRTDAAALEAAAGDESSLPRVRPQAVAFPRTTEEVAAIVRVARAHRVPLTPRGAGSSLEGNPIPALGGLVVDLTGMKRILDVRPADLQADVECGVVYAELNRQLRPSGLFFPPSPGGSGDVATIGGMVANNASGIYSARYGGTGDHVRALRIVTGGGEVMRIGNRCRKHSSGYDLVHLIVGSEGTLALVTEITLSLAGLPERRERRAYAFPSDEAATAAVAELLRYGVDIAAAEFLDAATVAAIRRFSRLDLPERPLLLVEVHGLAAAVDAAIAAACEICEAAGGSPLALPPGLDPWRDVREKATRAVIAAHQGARVVRADLAVPPSALPELVGQAARAAAAAGARTCVFGHAGSGILHVLMPVAPDGQEAAEAARSRLVEWAVAVGGAVSGEHGMGLGNRAHAPVAFGPALPLMRAIKSVFDPDGILNPGKIWPAEPGSR